MKVANEVNMIIEKFDNSKKYLSTIQQSILEELEKHPGGLIRGQKSEEGSLMKILNMARTTLHDNLVKLQKLKHVEKYSKHDGQGRPLIYWKSKE